MMAATLRASHCRPRSAATARLTGKALDDMLNALPAWQKYTDTDAIWREYRFKNYYQTIAFVNALAWVAQAEDHHPDLEVGYNRCKVTYSTHAIGGLSENDFICAAKIDALLNEKA